MTRRRLAVAAIVSVLSVPACSTVPAASIDRLDARVTVAADGTADVTEEAAVRFDVPGAMLERRIGGQWADAVSFASAALDNVPLMRGDSALDVRDGRTLRVRIRTSTASASLRQVVLRYRVLGGVKLEGTRGLLSIPVLSADRTSAIGEASVRIDLPKGVEPLEGSGMAEADWTVERRPFGLFASRPRVEARESATIMVRFEMARGTIPEPSWQMDQDRARGLMPAFLSAGIFILVVGAGILWIVRFQYPKRGADLASAERADVRRGLRLAGMATMAFSLLTAVLVWWLLSPLGPAPMALPASIFIVGFAMVAVSRWWV